MIAAPRRWWKSLVRDTQQLGWRSCRHEPCLMTWHVRGKLRGLICFHVDDVMISGPKNDPEFKRMMYKVKRLEEWAHGNSCIRQAADKSVSVDQESYALGKIGLITISAHRRKHMSKILFEEEHTTLMAKRCALNWLATQCMIQLLAPFESHQHVENSHRTKIQGSESTRATGAFLKRLTSCIIL